MPEHDDVSSGESEKEDRPVRHQVQHPLQPAIIIRAPQQTDPAKQEPSHPKQRHDVDNRELAQNRVAIPIKTDDIDEADNEQQKCHHHK